ncbi:hypothetical protein EV122DRAFT_256654 [Schizophyllum commune]
MPTSSPLGLPLAQSSTCRHAITASDLVGPHEYADDVAPAEKRTGSSQSHTCKNQPPGLYASSTQSQRVPAVNPQFGSEPPGAPKFAHEQSTEVQRPIYAPKDIETRRGAAEISSKHPPSTLDPRPAFQSFRILDRTFVFIAHTRATHTNHHHTTTYTPNSHCGQSSALSRRLPTSPPPPTYVLVYFVVAVCCQVLLSLRRRWCIDTVRTPAPLVHCALTIYPLESIKAIAVLSLSGDGDELGLELWISISPCLFRPTRALAFAFKHGPSLRFERNLAHFLKRVFVLAFKFTFTLKLIPFFFKSNLGLRLKLLLMTLQSSLVILGLFSDLGTTQGDYLTGDLRVVGLTATSSTFFRPH